MLSKIGVPQNRWFIMQNLIKMDDLGVPLFSETPIDTQYITSPNTALLSHHSTHTISIDLDPPKGGNFFWISEYMMSVYILALLSMTFPIANIYIYVCIYIYMISKYFKLKFPNSNQKKNTMFKFQVQTHISFETKTSHLPSEICSEILPK